VHVSFAPVARADAKVLILGTLPGTESLKQRRYYALKHNAFWRIMGELAGASPDLPYEERLECLKAHHIALWDVCAEAERQGALDSAIKAPKVNDFASFFASHPAIARVCFNGQTAAKLFHKLVPVPGIPTHLIFTTLPSTSPAHASLRYEGKLARWREAIGAIVTS